MHEIMIAESSVSYNGPGTRELDQELFEGLMISVGNGTSGFLRAIIAAAASVVFGGFCIRPDKV